MLMAGKQVTQINDTLTEVTIDRLYKGITNTNGPLVAQIQQLRSLKLMDENQYRRLKTQLPYVVAAIFSPPVRRKENFRYTQFFIIDIDHISSFDYTPAYIRKILQHDEYVHLLFVSPGGDGLKAIFKLKEKIDDASFYSYFYKLFATRFATQYNLQGMVDVKTCDVSRCCFLSYDTEAFFNAEAKAIDAQEYIDKNTPAGLTQIEKQIQEAAKEHDDALQKTQGHTADLPQPAQVANDVLQQIKQRLNPSLTAKPARQFEQPPQLEELFAGLQHYLQQSGIEMRKITPIPYGRQVQAGAGKLMAEINIFYGKKGFSIVKTTKTGSNAELTELMGKLIQQYINEQQLM